MRSALFVGITTWNSSTFLPLCIETLRKTTNGCDLRIVVLDNSSSDGTRELARQLDLELVVRTLSQADAINLLFSMADAPHALLIHADVVFLNENWLNLCLDKFADQVALVSPEDIGCGPYSRPFGAGKPESSFLLFDVRKARQAKTCFWRRWHRLPYPRLALDLYGPHVTHNLPRRFAGRGLSWYPMEVHCSDALELPYYTPAYEPTVWSPELGCLRYGLGNFYSLDGQITHYHNWLDRALKDLPHDSCEEHRSGFPAAYITAYTKAFIADFRSGRLVVPAATPRTRQPHAL